MTIANNERFGLVGMGRRMVLVIRDQAYRKEPEVMSSQTSLGTLSVVSVYLAVIISQRQLCCVQFVTMRITTDQ
jgi:hypothetical protein